MAFDLNKAVRQAARNKKYAGARREILAAIRQGGDSEVVRINPFLEKDLFSLNKNDWIALTFGQSDWPALQQIRRSGSKLERHYIYFLCCYITANAERVLALHAHAAVISAAILRDDGDGVAEEFKKIEAEDRQSLYCVRTICALLSQEGETLKEWANAILRTDWLRKRFLYRR